MRLDERRCVDEAIRKRGEPIATGRGQCPAPRIRLVVAEENCEVKMSPAAHAGDVREHLALGDHGAWPKSRSWPDMPVLGEDDALRSLVTDENTTAKSWIDYVADDHPIRGCSHRLDACANVDAGVEPDRTGRRAAPENCAVAQAPLAAEPEAVRLPGGQRELERVSRPGGNWSRHSDGGAFGLSHGHQRPDHAQSSRDSRRCFGNSMHRKAQVTPCQFEDRRSTCQSGWRPVRPLWRY